MIMRTGWTLGGSNSTEMTVYHAVQSEEMFRKTPLSINRACYEVSQACNLIGRRINNILYNA